MNGDNTSQPVTGLAPHPEAALDQGKHMHLTCGVLWAGDPRDIMCLHREQRDLLCWVLSGPLPALEVTRLQLATLTSHSEAFPPSC